jgi:hypothetical protein
MQPDWAGVRALKIYWEQDRGWSADTPDGKTLLPAGYQTPFSAFKEGDYTNCVKKFTTLTSSTMTVLPSRLLMKHR